MNNQSEESILSTGIDIGTTTTQVIFSRLKLNNTGGFGKAPRFEIVNKEIIYRSPIHLTPINSEDQIDETGIRSLISREYRHAGFLPKDIDSGALIITGESVKKRNAETVSQAISRWAGDFVIAAAGPDLESILAGKGSGAEELSLKSGKKVINIDIGGGTSNIACFHKGKLIDTACLNIGGRNIRVKDSIIISITPQIQYLIEKENITLSIGDSLNESAVKDSLAHITKRLIQLLEDTVFSRNSDPLLNQFINGKWLENAGFPDIITLSGGVAECYQHNYSDQYAFGDIGILLAKGLQECRFTNRIHFPRHWETVNATVIGAGNFSMDLSGSTIFFRNCQFPLKNIPVIPVSFCQEDNTEGDSTMKKRISGFLSESPNKIFALAGDGISNPGFYEIETLAETLYQIWNNSMTTPLIIIMKHDMAKVLGQALYRRFQNRIPLLCLDNIECRRGDYIDIGIPLASGKVLPVIIKTLVFGGEKQYET